LDRFSAALWMLLVRLTPMVPTPQPPLLAPPGIDITPTIHIVFSCESSFPDLDPPAHPSFPASILFQLGFFPTRAWPRRLSEPPCSAQPKTLWRFRHEVNQVKRFAFTMGSPGFFPSLFRTPVFPAVERPPPLFLFFA